MPTITSSRIARISVYAVTAVVFPAYSGFLVSYLTVHIPKIPFTDLESFVQDGSYKLTTLSFKYATYYYNVRALEV